MVSPGVPVTFGTRGLGREQGLVLTTGHRLSPHLPQSSRADFRVHFLLFRRWQVIIGVICEVQDVAALGVSCLILLGFRGIRRRKNKRKWAKQNRTACWKAAWCNTVGGILNPTVAASVGA